ncbi:MAG TPA: TldD/PmbA family protein [Anaerolineae bacterium]|nr:TldD/PmbA family protein [Anaerolineae bacterium]
MTDSVLPPELEAIRSRLPEMVADLERRAPYGAALATSSAGLQVAVSDRESRVSEDQRSQGAVLSAWNGAFLQERAVGSLAPEALAGAAHALAAELELRPGPAPEPGPPRDEHLSRPTEIDPRTQTPRDKLELCQRYHAAVRGLDPHIVNAMVTYNETAEAKVFAGRGRLLSQSITRIRFQILLIVSDGQKVQRDWLMRDGTGGLEIAHIADDELRALAAEAAALLGAGRIEPGFYDVVFDPTVSGVMAHEAFGHGVEADMFVKGRARAAEHLGKRVGSPLVNLLDDPTVPGAYGSYLLDDEGQVAAPTTILREGVFERGLTDLYSAFRLGIPRTANGRRQGYERKAYARMSNTFFARGTTPVDELIAGVERGVYLRKTSSGMEDPKGWGVQVEANIGEEIAGGRRTGRLFSPVGITGYVPDILASVSAVGNDFALDGGNCGKGWKEWVPVSSGGPHLRLKARLG